MLLYHRKLCLEERLMILDHLQKLYSGLGQFDPPCGFSINISSREKVKPWFFVTFNNIISHIFPKNVIEIPQVVQKIWRFSLSMLTIFINFMTFPYYKETDGNSIKQMMSAFFYFQFTLNRLFNNCFIKLYWY